MKAWLKPETTFQCHLKWPLGVTQDAWLLLFNFASVHSGLRSDRVTILNPSLGSAIISGFVFLYHDFYRAYSTLQSSLPYRKRSDYSFVPSPLFCLLVMPGWGLLDPFGSQACYELQPWNYASQRESKSNTVLYYSGSKQTSLDFYFYMHRPSTIFSNEIDINQIWSNTIKLGVIKIVVLHSTTNITCFCHLTFDERYVWLHPPRSWAYPREKRWADKTGMVGQRSLWLFQSISSFISWQCMRGCGRCCVVQIDPEAIRWL